MSSWLDLSDNANCFKQTYVQGFVDISGGNIITRGPNDGIVIGGDSSLNGTVYLGDSIFVRSDGRVAPPVFVDASYADVSGGAFIGDLVSYDISGGPTVEGSTLSTSLSSDASWSQLGFDIDGELAGDQSGRSVSLINSATYGRVVAIGARLNDGSGNNAGHVRVYQYRTITETNWTNYNITDASYNGIAPYDKTIVIGASGDAVPDSSKKYWVQIGADIDGELAGDESGVSVSLVDSSIGLVVAIGAIYNDGTTTSTSDNRGHVRVYQYDATKTEAIITDASANYGPIGWRRLGADIDGEAGSDYAGFSVSLVDSSTSGLVVAIGASSNASYRGHVRVYQYSSTKTSPQPDQGQPNYGPVGWNRLGADIDGEAASDFSGQSVSLVDSAAGLVVAIGATQNDGTETSISDSRGHVRVYQYDASKNSLIIDPNSSDYGPIGWRRLGADIDGEAKYDQSGYSVSLVDSADGLVVAIGANSNNGTPVLSSRGHVRVYQYDASKNEAIITDASANYGPIGWRRLGADIDGEAKNDQSGYSVSLVDSATSGLVVAIGAWYNDGTETSTSDNRGHVRVYQYDASKTGLITDQNSSDYGPIGWRRLGADIDGEATNDQSGQSVSLVDSADGLVVAIGAYNNDGIVASRTFKVRSDGFNYTIDGFAGNFPVITLQRNTVYYFDVSEVSSSHPFALRNGDGITTAVSGTTNNDPAAGVHQGSANTIITYTPTAAGTIVYQCVNHSNMIGTINIIVEDNRGHVRVYEIPYTKTYSDVSGGFFDVQVASNGATPFYVDASYVDVSGQPGVVGISYDLSGGPTVEGSTLLSSSLSSDASWSQLGFDIDGETSGDQSGRSVSLVNSATYGRVVAIGSTGNDGTSTRAGDNRGHVRVYQYNAAKTNEQPNQTLPNFGPVGWNRLGADIDGEAIGDGNDSGFSVSLVSSATHGLVVAIGAPGNNSFRGHVRIYRYNGSSWVQMGADIDGTSGVTSNAGWSVSLVDSGANGLVVAIGAYRDNGTGGNATWSGHVRVYQYNAAKTSEVANEGAANFGPIGWNRLGADIDGEAGFFLGGDESGYSVSLVDSSNNGLVVAIGAIKNDGAAVSTNTSDNRGHVRVYQYNAAKTSAQTNQSQPNFGPVGWNRLGADIDGELAGDQSGYSVSLVDSSANGLVAAIGAPGNDAGRGHVCVYQYTGSVWSKLGADIDGELAGDGLGYSASLVDSAAGLIVAIGAPGNDGTNTGNVGDDRGHVRVYQYNGSTWTQFGGDIDGEAQNDFSGASVSLVDSADGLVVAIAAQRNDGIAAIPSRTFKVRSNGDQYTIDGFAGNFPVLSLMANTTYYFDVSDVSTSHPFALRNSSGDTTAVSGTTNNDPDVGRHQGSTDTIITYTRTGAGTIVYRSINNSTTFGTINILADDNIGHVRVYEIPYTKTYSDVSGGFFDVSVLGGYLNDGLTTAALYVNGDTDLSGGLTVSGDVSFNAGNLFVAGDLSLNGNLSVGTFAANSIGADAIDSTVDIEFANKLSVSVADLSFNTTGLQVATDFNSDNTPINLAANLTVPANIAIVDGSNGTVYGSYLTLTNKDATAYYNVGKSASGIFNIVDQANAGVYLASGGTSFTGTSDARLKTNVVPLESATDKIMALNPCTYQWKSEVESTNNTTNKTNTNTTTKTHIGFIAQEVEKVMPELVHPIDHPAGPDYKGVNTTDLIPYLVRTIQENARKLAELRAGVDAYKNQ